jgi:4-hydroxy-3-methylbut-2-enyl diphosphate reductase
MGYFLLLHGDRQHPEIIGLAGYGGGNLAVVGTEEDLITAAARVEGRPTALLAQTTDGMEQFTVFARLAEGYFPNLQVHMTICRGTVERRNELATNLATGNFDLTVVIGGLQSSNSLALAELARRGNGRVLHLENAAALARYLPLKAGNILIASGTSTPSEEVDAVEAIFRTLPVNLESPPGQVGTI